MHSLILITAMSATTGLFGGKHCGQPKHHARRAVSSCYSASPCGATTSAPYATPQGITSMPSAQGYPTAPAKMVPATPTPSSIPPAPPVPTTSTSPSSALAPVGQSVVATGDLR